MRSTQYPGNTRYDRVELLPTFSKPTNSVDRCVLHSPGPLRTPRVVHRTSPYSNRSPSPDPKFQSSLPSTLPPSSSVLPRSTPVSPQPPNNPLSKGYTIYKQNSSPIRPIKPRIIPSRITSDTLDATPQAGLGSQDIPENPNDTTSVVAGEDLGDDSDDGFVSDGKIAKPPGEVSRPGRGGYNLRHELRWSSERFNKVKRFIDEIVESKLDCLQPLSKQDLSKVEQVRSMAVKKFSILNDYRDHWVVYDFIRCHLKYRKQALQKIALGKAAADAQQEIQDFKRRLKVAEKNAKDKQKAKSSSDK